MSSKLGWQQWQRWAFLTLTTRDFIIGQCDKSRFRHPEICNKDVYVDLENLRLDAYKLRGPQHWMWSKKICAHLLNKASAMCWRLNFSLCCDLRGMQVWFWRLGYCLWEKIWKWLENIAIVVRHFCLLNRMGVYSVMWVVLVKLEAEVWTEAAEALGEGQDVKFWIDLEECQKINLDFRPRKKVWYPGQWLLAYSYGQATFNIIVWTDI